MSGGEKVKERGTGYLGQEKEKANGLVCAAVVVRYPPHPVMSRVLSMYEATNGPECMKCMTYATYSIPFTWYE